MIKQIKSHIFEEAKRKLDKDIVMNRIWVIDTVFNSNFSMIRGSIRGNVYRVLVRNGCIDGRFTKVTAQTRTITRSYVLE